MFGVMKMKTDIIFIDESISVCLKPAGLDSQEDMCALLREAEGGVKLSVRCVPGYDAAAVCARFGGGGHKGASGATMDMDLAQAAQAVEAVLLELYGG